MSDAWEVVIERQAEKDLRDLSRVIRERIDATIRALAEQPRPGRSEKMVGYRTTYRIRVADYRILYDVDEERREVHIWRVAHRRDVYRRK
jgi:mRNA interferase RelE/StbE